MSQKEAKQMPEFDENLFRERFIELREDYDMKQAEFAEFLGIPTGSVGGYESGKKFPNGKTLFKISKKCNISADYLIGLSDVKSTNIEVKSICDYTGLSEMAVAKLHFFKESNQLHSEIISAFIAPDFKANTFCGLSFVCRMLELYEKEYLKNIEEMDEAYNNFDEMQINEIELLEDFKEYMANKARSAKVSYYEAVDAFKNTIDEYVDNKIKTPEREIVSNDFWDAMAEKELELLAKINEKGETDGKHN